MRNSPVAVACLNLDKSRRDNIITKYIGPKDKVILAVDIILILKVAHRLCLVLLQSLVGQYRPTMPLSTIHV